MQHDIPCDPKIVYAVNTSICVCKYVTSILSWDHLMLSTMYSGTSEQRPPSGTSLLAFVERLALVRRFCVKHPRFDVFCTYSLLKAE